MKKHHEVKKVKVKGDVLYLVVDGKEIKRDLKDVSPLLASATQEERNEFEVSPSGYGIHWPLIDEDISIDGLLGISHEPNESRRRA